MVGDGAEVMYVSQTRGALIAHFVSCCQKRAKGAKKIEGLL